MLVFGIAAGALCATAGLLCLVAPGTVRSWENRAPRSIRNWGGRDLWRNHETARTRVAGVAFLVLAGAFLALAFSG